MRTIKQAYRAINGAARAAIRRGEVTPYGHIEGALEFDSEGATLVSNWTGLPRYAPWGLSAYQVTIAARYTAEKKI